MQSEPARRARWCREWRWGVAGFRKVGTIYLVPKIETKNRETSHKQFVLFSSSVGGSHGVSTVEIDRGRFVDFCTTIFVTMLLLFNTTRMVFSSLSRGASKIASKTKTKTKLRSQTGPRIFRHTKDILVTLLAASGLHNFAQRHAMSTQRNA